MAGLMPRVVSTLSLAGALLAASGCGDSVSTPTEQQVDDEDWVELARFDDDDIGEEFTTIEIDFSSPGDVEQWKMRWEAAAEADPPDGDRFGLGLARECGSEADQTVFSVTYDADGEGADGEWRESGENYLEGIRHCLFVMPAAGISWEARVMAPEEAEESLEIRVNDEPWSPAEDEEQEEREEDDGSEERDEGDEERDAEEETDEENEEEEDEDDDEEGEEDEREENPDEPGAVTDLEVLGAKESRVHIKFTQVGDGSGGPAKYDIRFSEPPIRWGSATVVSEGSCATPVRGSDAGAKLTCWIEGLEPGTEYEIQLVSYRGILNEDAVFGDLSNVVRATTEESG